MKTVLTVKWCIEDVIQSAKQRNIKLTKKEASDVLSLAEHRHDASIGINWDVLDYHIDQIVDERG